MLQLTIWKKGLLKCRKKRSGMFLIGMSTLPEAYLPCCAPPQQGRAGEEGLQGGRVCWEEHGQNMRNWWASQLRRCWLRGTGTIRAL